MCRQPVKVECRKGPNPQAASWYSPCLQGNTISPNLVQDWLRSQKHKSTTWVKRCDDDSGKVDRPVGGEHAAAELGVGVGGVGGEGGLGGQLSILLHIALG